jgi:hypothetical protein
VTVVLVDGQGALLGALPPFDVEVPWWPEVGEIVAGVRERWQIDVQVLRLLSADGRAPGGGHVTYLASSPSGLPAGVALAPVEVDLSPQPRRAAYAEPGGPEATVRWAVDALAALGTPGATATQRKTWNLSGIWRLDAGGAPVAWLKQVPRFFDHEAAVLGLVSGVAPGLVPPVLAVGDEGRTLLAHIPGEDRFGAGAGFCALVAEGFHPVQAHFAGRDAELLAAGVPDGRLDTAAYARVAAPFYDTIDGLRALIEGLPERLAEAAACGLPDTLVHGDLHPGNVRSLDSARADDLRVIMDWGDATVGSPVFDILRLTGDLNDPAPLIEAWVRRWLSTAPGCDPARAIELLAPVAELRAAAAYAGFLANIEPAEWPYHADDVPDRLARSIGQRGHEGHRGRERPTVGP